MRQSFHAVTIFFWQYKDICHAFLSNEDEEDSNGSMFKQVKSGKYTRTRDSVQRYMHKQSRTLRKDTEKLKYTR